MDERTGKPLKVNDKLKQKYTKTELFASAPIPRALASMAIPTIISQLVNLVYNMVDAFFIGRTGNSYMMAATGLTLTLTMMNVAFANLYGIGGGSLIARLLGQKREEEAKAVSAFSFFAAIGLAAFYVALIGIFLDPILKFLGASSETMDYARSYALIVIGSGSLPSIMSLTIAHLLRNTGNASKASFGLSLGGVLNILLDPLFMFVILPKGQEVVGAALATLISNTASLVYLLIAYIRAEKNSPLRLSPKLLKEVKRDHIKEIFSVGLPSAALPGLFDLANVSLNILAASHSDLAVAAFSIVMKIERVPNAINIGLCSGMLPIVAYNYASGNKERMQKTIRTARFIGLGISFLSILLLELLARPASALFLNTENEYAETALKTVALAAAFLRIRVLASPVQFLNYHSSFSLQAIGSGGATLLHAVVRELVFYIPFMWILDHFFGEYGLAAALPVAELCGAVFAILLLRHVLKKRAEAKKLEKVHRDGLKEEPEIKD